MGNAESSKAETFERECGGCNKVFQSQPKQCFCVDLPFPKGVEGAVTLQQCADEFSKPEVIGGPNAIRCDVEGAVGRRGGPGCGATCEARITRGIDVAGDCVILMLKRYQTNPDPAVQDGLPLLTTPVDILHSRTVQLGEWRGRLAATQLRSGVTRKVGHWRCVSNRDHSWWLSSDTFVGKVVGLNWMKDVRVQSEASVFVYVKVDEGSDSESEPQPEPADDIADQLASQVECDYGDDF
eukprot:gene3900-4929_t